MLFAAQLSASEKENSDSGNEVPETSLLISEKETPEEAMSRIAHRPKTLTQTQNKTAENGKKSDSKTREDEDEKFFQEQNRKNLKALRKRIAVAERWFAMWMNHAPRPTNIIFCSRKKRPEPEKPVPVLPEKDSAADSETPPAETILTDSDSQSSASLPLARFTLRSMSPYGISVAAETESSSGTAVTIPENAIYYDGGETSVGTSSYNWCAPWTFLFTNVDATLGDETHGDYTNDSANDVVVFDIEHNTANNYTVSVKGEVTPKAIIIKDGTYTIAPKDSAYFEQNIDGQIGGSASLTVCENATLTLTDDNSYSGDTHIYGTVILTEDNQMRDTAGNELGTGNVYVYENANLQLSSHHLNNSSLNVQGGSLVFSAPEDADNVTAYILLKDADSNHAADGAVITLGENGSGGTIDLNGNWAKGHFELSSGTLTDGTISGKIGINVAAGEKLEINNVYFNESDSATDPAHTHSATIESGGQIVISGGTKLELNSLTLNLGTTDLSTAVPAISVGTAVSGNELTVDALTINIDDAMLEELVANSADGKIAYQAVSVANMPAGANVSDYVKKNFTSVTVNDGSRWVAEVNADTGEIFFAAIPEPAALALLIGGASAFAAGFRRRRRSR